MSILGVGGGAVGVSGFYPHTIDQSLRFDGSTSKFEITPSSDGNRKKWTTSWWVKRAKLGALQYMWSGASYYGNDGISALYFNSDDKLHMYFDANTHPYGAINNRVYRDTTNWYHIVWAVDAENTATKVYVNGVEETSAIQPPNFSYGMNKASTKMGFGVATWGGSPNYDGYCAEFVHLDGQYLTADSFGEFKNGVWVGKNINEQGFTFGTNGFYLPFSDSSNIGYDYQTTDRSTTNDVTTTGLASSDVVLDSPTSNFATLNVLQTSNNASTFYFSEGSLGLNVTNNSGYRNCSATFSPMGIKGYFEFCVTTGTPNFYIGVIEDTTYPTNLDYADTSHNYTALVHNSGVYQNAVIPSQGNKIVRGGSTYLPHNIGTISAGDVLGMAFDFTGTNRRIWFHRANTYGTSSSGVGNPSTGANPVQSETYLNSTSDYRFHFGANTGSGLQTIIFNFGQDGTFNGTKTAQGNKDASGNGDFFYAVPTDFIALCSALLSDTTLSPNQLENASDYFNTKLWTGTGASADAKTGVGFQPDWLWAKDRNYANGHHLFDSSRGVDNYLSSDSNASETNNSGYALQSFDADGFTTVGQGINYLNVSDYVGWNWRCGGTTPTKTYKVVVVSDSGNKYRFRNSSDSATFPQSGVTLNLQELGTYVFDYSDSSAQGHPFRFSTTSDGTHGGGSEYTTGVVKDDSNYKITITVASSAPQLYFYCSIHSGMGGSVNTNSTFGSTNFDGEVLSITQNNSNAGFSIATFTGSSASSSTFSVGHGLGSTPKMIIAKQRNLASGWSVYHHKIDSSSPEGYYILLNSSGARVSSSTGWGNTAPTSTVFSTYTTGFWGTSAEIVAYCFDEVEGHSKLGSYIGNGSSSGQYIHIGFRVAFIMFKRTNSADNWWIHDNKRNTFNPTINYLSANTNNVEYSNLSEVVDFTSNGVKIRTTTTALNANGSTYIYMAFGDGNTAKFGNSR